MRGSSRSSDVGPRWGMRACPRRGAGRRLGGVAAGDGASARGPGWAGPLSSGAGSSRGSLCGREGGGAVAAGGQGFGRRPGPGRPLRGRAIGSPPPAARPRGGPRSPTTARAGDGTRLRPRAWGSCLPGAKPADRARGRAARPPSEARARPASAAGRAPGPEPIRIAFHHPTRHRRHADATSILIPSTLDATGRSVNSSGIRVVGQFEVESVLKPQVTPAMAAGVTNRLRIDRRYLGALID